MSEWFNKLSSGTLPAIRDFFELELLYSYVYILSPSPRCPKPSEHAQRLIFEHCIAYAEKLKSITSNPTEAKNPLTFYDAIRVYTTGRHFLNVLAGNLESLLRPSTTASTSDLNISSLDAEVDPLALQATIEPPPIPAPAGDTPGGLPMDQTSRTIDAINNFIEILSYFGLRFGVVGGINHRARFQQESQIMLSQLYQRNQQIEQGYGGWNNNGATVNSGPVTPPTHLSPSPGPNGTFYPSPASTHYSPSSAYVPQVPHDMSTQAMTGGWASLNGAGSTSFLTSSMPDVSGSSMMAPVGLDNLGIGNFAAWETLPGGNLNARFA